MGLIHQRKNRQAIDAFEMWVYRRLMKSSWTVRRTNNSIINQLNIYAPDVYYLRFWKYHPQTFLQLGKTGDSGKVKGNRPLKGHSLKRWIDQIREILDQPMEQALRRGEE